MPNLIIFANTGPGMGGGHLARAKALAASLGDRAKIVEVDGSRAHPESEIGIPLKERSVVVFDFRATAGSMLDAFGQNRYTVGIDEGGRNRERFHYLIDISMALKAPGAGNMPVSPYPRISPPREQVAAAAAFPPEKILLSFGSEDKAGLTRKLLDLLLETGLATGKRITVCEGPRYRRAHPDDPLWPPEVEVRHSPASLHELLSANDLVFTHFGLTAYEAISAGTALILFNPSNYHRFLSKRAGFPEIGVGRPQAGKLRRFLESPFLLKDFLSRARREMETARADTLQAVVTRIEPAGLPQCPACGRPTGKAVVRFSDRTYFRCSKCSIYHMIRFFGSRKEYSRDYFFKEYSKQYGRTYLEDFDNIKASGKFRMAEILKVAGKQSVGTEDGRSVPDPLSLLDVGCAYGPFLSAAKEAGVKPEGMDISPDAVEWVKKELGINAFTGDFASSVPEKTQKYDIITMWYVIEHFIDLKAVLERVNRLLPKGGVFAFSTPSYGGVSGRRNLRLFLQASPADHFSIWSAQAAKRCLKQAGFVARRIRVTGHHPERFANRFARDRAKPLNPGSLGYRFFGLVSRVFGLGDTFEAYAVKKRDL